MLFLFLAPFALLLVVLGVALLGFSALPNLLLGCLNLCVIGSFMTYLLVRKLPFSAALEGANQGGTFIRTMLFLIVPGLLGVGHWLLSGFQWVIGLWIVLSAVAFWLILDEVKKKGWQNLQ